MSLVKYRLKEVATDFSKTPKDIADIVGKFYEKPKSNTLPPSSPARRKSCSKNSPTSPTSKR